MLIHISLPGRTPRPKLELHIDPDLERELALKQLMEFSSRKPRRGKNGNNAEAIKTEKGTKQEKREFCLLLQVFL